ncbi:MAG: chain length determinant protein tyrosine kinase EpsG [Betaproteobacteria bacterium]
MKGHPAPQIQEGVLFERSEIATGRLPLGQILVEAGRLLPQEVVQILGHQSGRSQRFGEAGLALGLLTEDDLRYALSVQFDYPYLGPDSPLAAELVAAHRPDSAQAEQWRALRSQLALRWLRGAAPPHALAVLSPDRGEGRSNAAANLAISFAQLGRRTLLMDADLRQPRQHELFKLGRGGGLSDLLAERARGEVIAPVPDLRCLAVLPAGTPAPNPQELLGRPQFAQLLHALAQEYELIVVDTPAASLYADAHTVAQRCGAALLMARLNATSLPRLARLRQGLQDYDVALVGSVLNEV